MVPVFSRLALSLWLLACFRGACAADDPISLFTANCAPCHGKDGRARTPMARKLGVKDLTQSKLADAEIERQIREGRKGSDGKQAMPAFGDKLSAEQVKMIIAAVKGLRP